MADAQQLPTGGSVTAGSASIVQPNAGTLNINQSTNQAIINWQSFSLGQGGTVNFNQPSSSSATLNRVLGSTPSSIAGTINAPGTVLLVNPNGIAITKSGIVNTGSFAASTLDIKDSDFLAGNYKFTGKGGSAAVSNAGRINVSDGGFAALLGGQVANDGVISARLGKVGLGAGEMITLDLAGDGFLSVAVPSTQLGNLVDPNGALVTNRGKIKADGGTVFLSAATAANLLRNAVNIPGSIRTNTVGTRNGKIVINGGAGGKVNVSGRLVAKGRNAGEKGGKIDITGANVELASALIDASGAAGGGLIRIGGTFQGGNGDPTSALYQSYIGRFGALPDIASAESVTVDGATRINVSATQSGDAGTAVIWSNDTTTFAGTVTGLGAGGGNGGFVEASGKLHLAVSGSFDLSASSGKFGTVLFDPGSINIQSGGNSYAGSDTLNDGYLNGLLAVADVIVDTNYATGANGATGDITLLNGAAISWNATTTLTLNAARNIVFQSGSSVFTSAGSVVLAAGNNASGTGTVTFQGAGAQITETGGGNVTVYYNPASFGVADFNAAGVSGNLTAYMLVNNNGQMNAINGNLSGNYALATDLNFGTFGGFNVNGYFQPLGDFSGKFDGRNHSINFTVYSNQSASQGLFQSINAAGVVRNLNLTALISSGFYLGGLTGTNNGLIDNVSATVNSNWVFDFNNSYSTGATNGLGTTFIGGLVGINNGTISNSTASLTANGIGGFIGGLVGRNSGTITGSSSTGGLVRPDGAKANNNPTFVFNAGGLVGWNDSNGVISTSWSSARVFDQGLASLTTKDGGFVGYNEGSISNSYATGLVQGGQIVGGFVGQNLGHITLSFSTGAASATPGSGFSGDVGGFAGWNGIVLNGNTIGALPAATVTLSWTASPVSGSVTPLLRGFSAIDGGTNANNYFDVTATGQSNAATNQFGQNCACGALPITTTAQAYNIGFYSNAFKDGGWFIRNFDTRPIQLAFRTTTISATDPLMAAMQLELVGSWIGQAVTVMLARDIDLSIVQSSTMWSSNGWGPIGQTGGQFSGTFDGQGHTISNIYINTQTVNETGLFGYSDGTIKNVGLAGGSITGLQNVGSIAANNYGTIQDVYSTVNVTGYNNVGGLVSNNSGTILRSFTTGNVIGHTSGGDSQNTGGIAAFNYGTITDAYATGNVDSGLSSNDFAGGIVGFNNGTISNVYFSGTVTNGQAGKYGAIAGSNISIDQQSVESPPGSGNFITVNNIINYTISNGYWNSDTMGGTGVGDAGNGVGTLNGGGGLSYAAMTNQTNFYSTFAGFDFNSIWAPPNQSGQGGDAVAHTPGLYGPSNIIWLEGNNVSRTYGNGNSTLSYTLHGLRSGDPQWLITGLSLTSPVTSTTSVGTYDLSFGSPQATGRNSKAYRFTTSGTEAVTQRPLTGAVTIAGIDKEYDGNDTASGGAAILNAGNNVVNGDAVTLSALDGTYSTANVVGLQTVTLNSVSLNNGNYSLGTLNYSGSGTISAKTLTVALTGTVSKVYDGNNTATLTGANYTALSGVIAADIGNVSVNQPASGTYDNANAGTLKTVTVIGIGLTGTASGNYTISGTVSGTVGAITQRPLTGNASITGIDKTYDSTTAASGGSASLTLAGNNVVSVDTVVVSAASGTYSTPNVTASPQTVTVNAINIGNSNYSLGSLTFSGTGTINPAPLTVTATTDIKTYDRNTSSSQTPTITSGQLFGTDSANFSQAFASRNALGTNLSTLVASGSVNDTNGGANYTITFVNTPGTITPALLTLTAVTDNRVYNGTTSSAGTPQVVSGLVAGDSVGGFTQAYTSKNVAGTLGSTLAVNPGSGTVSDGNSGNNYTLAYQTVSGTITQAPLTVTAVTETRTYDGTANSSQTPAITSGQLFGTDTPGFTQSFASKNALGTNGSTLVATGTANDTNGGGNYNVTFVTTTGTINPAQLTIAAVTETRTYDGTTNSSQTPIITSGQLFGTDTPGFTQSFASKNALGSNNSTLVATGTANDTNGGANYTVTFVTASGTINPALLTVTAATDTKVYDSTTSSSGTPTVTSGQIFNGDTGNFSQVYTSKNVLGASNSTLVASGSVNDTNGSANYTIIFVDTPGTITPAPLTITAVTNTKTYDGNTTAAAIPTVSGLQGSTDTVTGRVQAYADPNVSVGKQLNVTAYTVNDGNGGNNYTVQTVADFTGVINPATLLYVATPASRLTGELNPAFTGTVTGFVNNETLQTATTGNLLFTSLANTASPPGDYAITGSGLSAINYVFDQAPANATALTVRQPPLNPTSQFTPGSNDGSNPGVNISFQPGSTGPVTVSFTPSPNLAANPPGTDISPAALPDGQALATNNGRDYPPISQFDANQYSQFTLPGFAPQAGLSTVLTMIARGADQPDAANYLIDKFWGGTAGAWTPAGAGLTGKVVFSDGAGPAIDPTGNAGFPIEAGKTDFAQLLKAGPVMINGGGDPVHWLLATQMAADGKGIVANDPATGKQVLLSYDPASKTAGGVTGVFDPSSKGFTTLATAAAGNPGDAALSSLQGIVPTSFIAVTVK